MRVTIRKILTVVNVVEKIEVHVGNNIQLCTYTLETTKHLSLNNANQLF